MKLSERYHFAEFFLFFICLISVLLPLLARDNMRVRFLIRSAGMQWKWREMEKRQNSTF